MRRRRLHQGWDLVIVQTRNDRRERDAYGNARLAQGAASRDSCLRTRGPWLEHRGEFRVQRRQREHHVHRAMLREIAQMIEVARDEGVLGDQSHRLTEVGEHGEAAARDLQLSLDRLVTIRHPAAGERGRHPRLLRQLRLEQFGRTFLHEQPRLKINPRVVAEVFVVGPRVAVGAAMLAAAVGIEAVGEADVRTVVRGDERFRIVAEELGAKASRLEIGIDLRDLFPRPVVALDREALEAVRRTLDRAATAMGKVDGHGCA